jgi:mycothiol system anti-sigma-R factor
MSYIEIQCGDVLASVIFIIEGELQEIPQADAITSHITTCGACAAEIEHERAVQQMLQDVLKRTCDEKAPEDLHQSIHRQLRAQMAGAATTEVVTQFSMTEISIEIDEFGNVEHREIQIEQTHIQHFIDDED